VIEEVPLTRLSFEFRPPSAGPYELPKEIQEMWDKGASNGGYHDFGSAKIFAQMGKAFADALLYL
jgi:hypothetical protein